MPALPRNARFFDLATDPMESHHAAQELRPADTRMDAETIENLKSLGYLDRD